MATTFITAPSSAGSASSLQSFSSSSTRDSASTTITATANVIERSGVAARPSGASSSSSSSSFSSSQFTLSAKTEIPEDGTMITIQSSGAGANASSTDGVQYLTDGEQIYAATNGSLRQFSQYAGETSPSDVGATYYDASGMQVVQRANPTSSSAKSIGVASQLTGLAAGAMPSQLVSHGGSTFILQGGGGGGIVSTSGGGAAAGSFEAEGVPIQHVTRASPATVQWLLEHFEPSEGVSLARCTLYSHYMRHCNEHNLDAMNAASFGKLIRSVFVGLKTRRLGTRGNSKYHYYGIRVKPNSPLNQYTDELYNAMRGYGGGGTGGGGTVGNAGGKKFRSGDFGAGVGGEHHNQQSYYDCGPVVTGHPQMDPAQQARIQEHQQYLGDASMVMADFPGILSGNIKTAEKMIELPEGLRGEDLLTFEALYRDHCESILDIVINLQFSLLESLWSSFWKRDDEGEDEMEEQLPKHKLMLLCRMELVQAFMRQCDHAFYQSLVEVLIPDVLRPIPSTLTQAIRNFAKSLDGWANSTMNELPREAFRVKVSSINAFSQTLRRYTSLNHLAQAARAVLQNSSQINQMLNDLNRVDFASVQEQAAWVCQCDDALVQSLEKDFKLTLQAQTSLEEWANWLESVVDQVLKPHEGSANFAKAARQFLLKWSFYSSMVIRDLTLRSAASFGSFHLIRLLYDEYMFFLIEHKVALSLGETPIGVMGSGGGVATGGVFLAGAGSADLLPVAPSRNAEVIDQRPSLSEKPKFSGSPPNNNNNAADGQLTLSGANVGADAVVQIPSVFASSQGGVIQISASQEDSLAAEVIALESLGAEETETVDRSVPDGLGVPVGSAPVGVIKQAGGVAAGVSAAAVVSTAPKTSTILTSGGKTYVVVQTPKTTSTTTNALETKVESVDDGVEPPAKRIKTE